MPQSEVTHTQEQIFTVDEEKAKPHNFLDITIKYDELGTTETNWSRKNLWSKRYLNHNSNALVNYKKSVVTGYLWFN